MKKLALLLLLTSLFFSLIEAQTSFENTLQLDSSTHIEKIEIKSLDWIAGAWVGEAFGAKTEEVWNKASGGSMMGMFKLYDDTEIIFYELMSIQELDASLILRIKHFDKNLHGWEGQNETVDFPFIKSSANKAFFDGLTFDLISRDSLNVYVRISQDDGTITEEKFEYKRVQSK